MRPPASTIALASGVCSRPSTVQSTTRSQVPSIFRTGSRPASAGDAPVDRTGTGSVTGGDGTVMLTTRAPSRASAAAASAGSSGRDSDSDTIATR